MSGWKSIKTAPKDETAVLLYFPDKWDTGRMGIAFWSDDSSMAFGGGWFDAECASHPVTDLGWGFPTHWMPLPTPPDQEPGI